MNQRGIKALLEEAAKPDCSMQRLNAIQCRFVEAVGTIPKSGGRKAGICLVLETLYADTVKNRRELLPALFPVFAIICGYKRDCLVADIDWSLV